MFELPTLNGVQEVVITADVVEGTARPLYTYSDKGQQQREQSASCHTRTRHGCAR